VPQQVIEYFDHVSKQDEKTLKKMLESGELPMFMDVLQSAVSGEPMQPLPAQQKLQAEVAELMAKAEIAKAMVGKVQAEAMENQAQAVREQAQAELYKAEAVKVLKEAEAAEALKILNLQKAKTEEVTQAVKNYGMTLDAERLKMRKAEAVVKLRQIQQGGSAANQNISGKLQKPYQETGLRSNNR